jgi:hypothetical protein
MLAKLEIAVGAEVVGQGVSNLGARHTIKVDSIRPVQAIGADSAESRAIGAVKPLTNYIGKASIKPIKGDRVGLFLKR